MPNQTTRLTSQQLQDITSRLQQNKQVRRTMPGWGRLHLDRQMPFMCVYRRPPDRADAGTERLIQSEASYLQAMGDRSHHRDLMKVVRLVTENLVREFGAILLIEVWSAASSEDQPAFVPSPHIRFFHPKSRTADKTVETLEEELSRVRVQRHKATVERIESSMFHPPGLSRLLSPADCKSLGCYYIGLEISPIFRDADTEQNFPFVLRSLQRSLGTALKRTFFTFARSETTHRPKHFQALGRRAMVKAVWDVDRRLAEVSQSFDLILLSSPTNAEKAWSAFNRKKFQSEPVFHYRPLHVEPSDLKRRLYEIPVDRVEDPSLMHLFRQKRLELDRQINMLQDRRTKNFLYGSLQLYGGVDTRLLTVAEDLLHRLPPRTRDDSRDQIGANEFAEYARDNMRQYRAMYLDFDAKVFVDSEINGLLVSKGNLYIGSGLKIPKSRVEALLSHEIGTHSLTYFNGMAQPFRQLYCGLSGYDELQEGIAVLSEYLVGGLSRPRLRLLAARVIASDMLVKGSTFIEVFRALHEDYGFQSRTAFMITMRTFRSGGLTKDAAYLRGLIELMGYLQKGGSLDPLFVGKIAAEHIPIVEELTWRKVLVEPPLKPLYLSSPQTKIRLEKVRNGMDVASLAAK